MATAYNPDLKSLLKLTPKAPPLPKPDGPVVRVGNVDELVKAIATSAAGATILAADGHYLIPPKLEITQNRITLRGESGDREKVIIDSANRRDIMLTVKGGNDVTFADMTWQNNELYGIRILGDSDAHRTRFHNLLFRNIYTRSIKGTHPSRPNDSGAGVIYPPEHAKRVSPSGGSIRHCLFINDHVKPKEGYHEPDYVSGIDMMMLRDWLIADNLFVGIRGLNGGGGGAIFIWHDCERVISERNVIINCDRGICYGNPSSKDVNMDGGIVRNNFIVGGANMAIEMNEVRNTGVYNNSVYATNFQYPHTVNFMRVGPGDRCFNNIVHGLVDLPKDVAQGHNLVGDLSGLFVDPAHADLHLVPEAKTAIGQGVPLPEVTEDFEGRARRNPPNIGADESHNGK